MDPLQWMGAVRMRLQTKKNYNNGQVIYMSPVRLVKQNVACLHETNPSLRHFNIKPSLLVKIPVHNS